MSVDAMNWVERCDLRGAGPSATAVANAVAWRAADAGDPNAERAFPRVDIPAGQAACWAGVAAIARRAGVNEKTCRTALKRLRDAGVLRIERRGRRDLGITRRVEDVIFLDLLCAPFFLERDEGISQKRAVAGRLGYKKMAERRASRKAAAEEAERASASGQCARSVGSASGHIARSVAADPSPSASGHFAGVPAGNLPGRQRAGSPGKELQGQDTRQDSGSTQSGTSPALGTTVVDDPEQADRRRRLDAARSALGDRNNRRIAPARSWAPLRKLPDDEFERLIKETLRRLIRVGDVDEVWWEGIPSQLDQVRHRVHVELLRRVAARDASGSAGAAEEVA